MFSFIIPTWNNLPFLKLCIESIRKYSEFEHEIIVHVNEGSDGTLDWVQAEGIQFSHTQKNIGVCLLVTHLVTLTTHDCVLYVNDDMVACPGWDTAFANAISTSATDLALYFSAFIQSKIGKNIHMVEMDLGSTPETFDVKGLLQNYLSELRDDAEGGTSKPTLFKLPPTLRMLGHPRITLRGDLFFPDWHALFQFVYHPATRFQGGYSMFCSGSNKYDVISTLYGADAVHDACVQQTKFLNSFAP
jgi:glycosyltransferase involved in cell wall biosynthesis